MKYRLKSIEVEAMQLTMDNLPQVCEFVGLQEMDFASRGFGCFRTASGYPGIMLKTLSGSELAIMTDWIVKSASGTVRRMANEDFHICYEPAP